MVSIRLFVLLLSLWLSACEKPNDNAINFAISTAPSSLHPTLASDAISERINALIYRVLIEFDHQHNPTPGVVSWKMLSADRFRLYLQDNLQTFANGHLPSIQDVFATLQSVKNNKASPHHATLSHINKLSVIDAKTLEVTLSRKDPRFIEKLHIGLAPSHAFENNDKLSRMPDGNGNFLFDRWRDDGGVVLIRRSDGQVINFEVVPDPTMRTLKMLRGNTQLIQNDLPYEMFQYLDEKRDISLKQTSGTTFSYLGFNLADPITSNRKIRLAIAHAIDRKAIVHYLFKDQAILANTVLSPTHWASHKALTPYAYNPEQSRKLLSELGYTPDKPLQLSYKTSTDPFRLRIAAVIQDQLAKVGINLIIQSYEWSTFFADIKAGRFQLYSLSWVGVRSPDIFRYIYHSASLPPNGANRGRYQSKFVDHVIDQAGEVESQQAKVFYKLAQEKIHKDLVYVPLWYENNLLLLQGVDNAQPNINGGYDFLNHVTLKND